MITTEELIEYTTVVNGFVLLYNRKSPNTYDIVAIGNLFEYLTTNFASKDWSTFSHIFSMINKVVLGLETLKMSVVESDPQLNNVYLKMLTLSLPIKTWLCRNGYST